MNPIRPEKIYPTVPELSGESEIISIVTSDYREGIILDSLDEVIAALRVYNGESIEEAYATQRNIQKELKKQIKREEGEAYIDFLFRKREEKNGPIFMEKLETMVLSEVKEKGWFHKRFEYGALGTNFSKTSVDVEKVEDKYVLGIIASYIGYKAEESLAETLKKPRALNNSYVEGVLSIVDDWWFNANLEDFLSVLNLSERQIKNWADYIPRQYGKRPKLTFKHQGQEFMLSISLDVNRYLMPEIGNEDLPPYITARGKNIVGGSWEYFDEKGREIETPRVINPSIRISVTLPKFNRYGKMVIVDENEIAKVQEARDYIAGLLRDKYKLF